MPQLADPGPDWVQSSIIRMQGDNEIQSAYTKSGEPSINICPDPFTCLTGLRLS